MYSIISLLNLGFKFIPCLHSNKLMIFKSILKELDSNFYKINSNFFFSSNKKQKDKIIDNIYNKFDSLPINISCDSIGCLLKFLKKPFDFNRIPLTKDSLEFRLALIKNLSRLQVNIKPNLDKEQLTTLLKFNKLKPFKVVEADKNVGSVILSNNLYDRLSFDSLSDITVYKKLDFDPLNDTIRKVNSTLEYLLLNGHISNKLYKLLIVDDSNSSLGKVRLLPKLHKEKFSCRTIINCRNHPTSNLSLLINLILQPFVQSRQSYIRDSQQLLQDALQLQLSQNSQLYSSVLNHSPRQAKTFQSTMPDRPISRANNHLRPAPSGFR